MPSWQFKVLYDGDCPVCRREVEWLKRRDRAGHLAVEDISALGFDPRKYGLSREDVTRVLHGVKCDGTVLRGMDAVRETYQTVGLGWVVAPTRLPLLRTLSDWAYSTFARHRGWVGWVVGATCPDGTCAVPSFPPHEDRDQKSSAPKRG